MMAGGLAVIIGVGSGLGAALVKRLAEEDFTVVAAARNMQRLRSVLHQQSGNDSVHLQQCDASSPAQVSALFAEALAAHGPPELVIFNVSSLERGQLSELDSARFEQAWRAICLGGFLVGQAAARQMLPAGRGTILFSGATSALRGRAGFAAPAAARAGLRALTQSMARELGPAGIHVAHVVIDGGISRPEFAERLAELPADSLLDPADIADAYLALHRQPRSAWSQEIDLRPWLENF